MNILLVKIPQVLFLPFAITALIGIAMLSFCKTERRSKNELILILFVLFQIAWRCYLPSISKRYASALIVPSCFFSAFATIHLWDYLLNKSGKNKAVFHYLSWGTSLGLFFSGLYESFHYNPYDKLIINNSAVIARDSIPFKKGVRVYSLSDTFLSRTQYYLPKNRNDIVVDPAIFPKHIDRNGVVNFIKKFRYDTRPSYFIVNLPASSPAISAEDVHISSNNWKAVDSFFVSKNRKRKTTLYRVIPFRPDEHETIRTNGDNLLTNGDFSNKHLQLISDLKQRGIPFFQEEISVPDSWSVTTPGGTSYSQTEFEHVVHDTETAMRMKCSSCLTVCNRTHYNIADYLFRFSVKSNSESKIYVSVHTYNNDHKWNSFDDFYVLHLSPMKSFQDFSVKLSRTDFHPEAASFIVCFKLDHGEVFIRDASLRLISEE